MPITEQQQTILRLIAGNRSPDSYVAGGLTINKSASSPRFPVDIFHDLADAVSTSAGMDAELLERNGFVVKWLMREPAFLRGEVAVSLGDKIRIEWGFDSAFRFFPLVKDEGCGYRLHYADAATNKVLAAAGRMESRDMLDLLYLHKTFLPLGALCWAASGKDPGLSPQGILDLLAWHGRYNPNEIDFRAGEELADPVVVKMLWLQSLEEAGRYIEQLPPEHVGCLYLDRQGKVVAPSARQAAQANEVRSHFGSVKGAWPRIGNDVSHFRYGDCRSTIRSLAEQQLSGEQKTPYTKILRERWRHERSGKRAIGSAGFRLKSRLGNAEKPSKMHLRCNSIEATPKPQDQSNAPDEPLEVVVRPVRDPDSDEGGERWAPSARPARVWESV